MNQRKVRAMMTNPRRVVTSESWTVMTAVTSEPSSFDSHYSILVFEVNHA